MCGCVRVCRWVGVGVCVGVDVCVGVGACVAAYEHWCMHGRMRARVRAHVRAQARACVCVHVVDTANLASILTTTSILAEVQSLEQGACHMR